MAPHLVMARLAMPCLALLSLVTSAGCKSPPTNPFAQQAAADRAKETSTPANDAAKAAADVAQSEAAIADPVTTLKAEAAEISQLGAGLAGAAAGLAHDSQAAAKDAASKVRQAAVQSAADQKQAVQQAAAHATDTARQVALQTTREAAQAAERAGVERIATLPTEQCGPLLLVIIAEGSPNARRLAAQKLSERWPAANNFPVEALAESREAALVELRKQWAVQYGEINTAVTERTQEIRALVELGETRTREVNDLVEALRRPDSQAEAKRQAAKALTEVGPPLLGVLEKQLAEQGVLPTALYTDVLPTVKPAFGTLVRLTQTDVTQRRAAAAELARQAATEKLPPVAVARLSELIESEQDAEVWRGALSAVANDSSQWATRMAYVGLANASADVRQAACQYLAEHGDPRHAQLLLRAVDDPQTTVRVAAVRALGAVGRLDSPQPIVSLLESPDKNLRVEAAVCLARLRAEQGATTLERMALDADYEVRLRAAQAMSDVADPVFLPALVAMLHDQAAVQQAALSGLTRIAGADIAADQGAATADDRVRHWEHWYAQRSATAAETKAVRR